MSEAVMREYDEEPVRGLPAPLPEGERILWQGSPCAVRLAKTAFHLRAVAVYFVLLMGWFGGSRLLAGDAGAALEAVLWTSVPAALALGLITFLGWAYARGTVYTVTDRRIVIRTGLALTAAIDIPLSLVSDAFLKSYGDGTGDLVIRTGEDERPSWIMLWPNVRPWHWRHPEPMLRVIPEASLVATLLVRELRRGAPAAERPAAQPDHAAPLVPVPG